jgi:hypothetical protein
MRWMKQDTVGFFLAAAIVISPLIGIAWILNIVSLNQPTIGPKALILPAIVGLAGAILCSLFVCWRAGAKPHFAAAHVAMAMLFSAILVSSFCVWGELALKVFQDNGDVRQNIENPIPNCGRETGSLLRLDFFHD